MTYAEILSTIMQEAFNMPRGVAEAILQSVRDKGRPHRLDDTLPDAEAERLLTSLRGEKDAIRQKALLTVMTDMLPPRGNA